jgi:hypothetical protein
LVGTFRLSQIETIDRFSFPIVFLFVLRLFWYSLSGRNGR